MLTRFDYRMIRQFLLFAIVLEEGSFRTAARRLNMSQPPLTAQIDELETRLKLKLLERSPRGVRATPEGEALLPEIQRFVSHAEELEFAVREIQAGHRALLTVGAVQEAMLCWVPLLRERLLAESAEFSIFTKEIDTADVDVTLEENPTALLIAHVKELENEDYGSLLVMREAPVVLVPKGHKFSTSTAAALTDFANEDWVFPGRDVSEGYVDELVAICLSHGFSPRVRHEVISTMQQIAYVSCGQGIALVPEFYVTFIPTSVIAVKLTDVVPSIDLTMVWNKKVSSVIRDRAIEISRKIVSL